MKEKQIKKIIFFKEPWPSIIRQGTSNMAVEFIFSWLSTSGHAAYPQSLSPVRLSFVSGYQLDIASGLETGAYVLFFQLQEHIWCR